jgi:hypothetical protein
MNIETTIRKVAKSIEHQNLFLSAKELNGIRLFNNEKEYSKLQQLYLSYLYFYNNLHTEIAMKEVSDKVLEDEIYEDAYAIYKKEKPEKKEGKNKKHNDIHLIFNRNKKGSK